MATERLQCAWCGRYLAPGTGLTCWRVRGRMIRQQEHDPWNYFCRLLCPGCSRAATIQTAWWEPVPELQVKLHTPELRNGPPPRCDEAPYVDDRYVEPVFGVDPEQEDPPRLRDSVLYLMTEKDTT